MEKYLHSSTICVYGVHSHNSYFQKITGCACRMQEKRFKLFEAHHMKRTNVLMWGQYIVWNGLPHDEVTLTCYTDNFIHNCFLFLTVAVMCLHIFRVQISQGRDAELNTIRVVVQCLRFLLLRRTLSFWKIGQPIVRPPNAPNQVLCTAFHIWTPQGNI